MNSPIQTLTSSSNMGSGWFSIAGTTMLINSVKSSTVQLSAIMPFYHHLMTNVKYMLCHTGVTYMWPHVMLWIGIYIYLPMHIKWPWSISLHNLSLRHFVFYFAICHIYFKWFSCGEKKFCNNQKRIRCTSYQQLLLRANQN